MQQTKLLLTALAATGVLAVLVGSASATRLAASSQTTRGAWSALVFEAPSSGVRVICPMTFEGTLHSRTITKTAESLIGYITRVIVGESRCTGGRVRILPESLPWHSRYGSFAGALPNITSITKRIVGAAWLLLINVLGTEISCLYRSTAAQPVTGTLTREAGGLLTTDRLGGEITSSTGGICPRGALSGTSTSLTVLGGTERIRVTLVA